MKSYTLTHIAVGVIAAFLALAFLIPQFQALGSVSQGSEYNATTTGESSAAADIFTLRNGQATLGSVVITGATTGEMEIYDATTTDSSLRDASQATATIRIAHIPASAAAGTLTFDILATRGLTVYMTGTQPTTTITWR